MKEKEMIFGLRAVIEAAEAGKGHRQSVGETRFAGRTVS